jgi:hypothetical protein
MVPKKPLVNQRGLAIFPDAKSFQQGQQLHAHVTLWVIGHIALGHIGNIPIFETII